MKTKMFTALLSICAICVICGSALAQQQVNSVPLQYIQPFDATKPLVQQYCSTNQLSIATNMVEWQPASDRQWQDPLRVKTPACWIDCAGQLHCTASCSSAFSSGCASSSPGTVTSFSAGDLSPLFTTSVANPTTTPALSFTLSNVAAYTLFVNDTSAPALPGFLSMDTFFGSCSGATNAWGWNTTTHAAICNTMPPPIPVYFGQGAEIASQGNNVITLGSTPITNAVDISYYSAATPWWSYEMIPGIDFTISGAIINLTRPLNAVDQVSVLWATTNSTPGGITLSGTQHAPSLCGIGPVDGSSMVVSTGNSFTVPFPRCAQAGDLALLFATSGYGINPPSFGPPIGWSSLDNHQQSYTWNGGTFSKILTSSDIIAGSITIATSNVFDAAFAMAVLDGPTAGIRETDVEFYDSPVTSITASTSGSVISTDALIIFASLGNGGTPGFPLISIGLGAQQQQQADGAFASAALNFLSPAASGINTANVTWPPPWGADAYEVIVVVKGNGPPNQPTGMVYPPAGIANSTGYLWGPSYAPSGNGSILATADSDLGSAGANSPACADGAGNIKTTGCPSGGGGTTLDVNSAGVSGTFNLNSSSPSPDANNVALTVKTTGAPPTAAIVEVPNLTASGTGHQAGLAPDPGNSSGTTKYLREDAQWEVPPSGGGTIMNANAAAVAGTFNLNSTTPSPDANNVALTVKTTGAPPTATIVEVPNLTASGTGHQAGLAPDPGGSSGTTKYLREDTQWEVPPGTGANVALSNLSGVGTGGSGPLTCSNLSDSNTGCSTAAFTPSGTQYAFTDYPTTSTNGSVTPSVTMGKFYEGRVNPTDATAPPSEIQLGFTPRGYSGTTDTIAWSDVNAGVNYTNTGAVAVELPTPTTLENTGFDVNLYNVASPAVTITPDGGWTISGNGLAPAASFACLFQQNCFLQVDPIVANNWNVIAHDAPGYVNAAAVPANQPTLQTNNLGQFVPGPVGGVTSPAPCDILATAGTPCVAAHSLTRRMLAAYSGNLFQIKRASDSTTLDIGTLSSGIVNAAAITTFCSGTTCKFSIIYDQMNTPSSGNNLPQATSANQAAVSWITLPNGLTLPIAELASGMYYRNRSSTVNMPTSSSSITEYMVVVNTPFYSFTAAAQPNFSVCCGGYGDMEATVSDHGAGHMFALAYSAGSGGTFGNGPGPWPGVDLENGTYLYGMTPNQAYLSILAKYNSATASMEVKSGDATQGGLITQYSGSLPDSYSPHWEGGLSLGEGGDGGSAPLSFLEGVITASAATHATDSMVQANLTNFYGSGTPAPTVGSASGGVGFSPFGGAATTLPNIFTVAGDYDGSAKPYPGDPGAGQFVIRGKTNPHIIFGIGLDTSNQTVRIQAQIQEAGQPTIKFQPAGGKVSIGNTTPVSALTVNGAISINIPYTPNTDNRGWITLNSGSPGTGSYTFNMGPGSSGIWNAAPVCIIQDDTTMANIATTTKTVTASTLTITGSVGVSDTYSYICWPAY